jgi:hypothetical protein
MLILDVSGIRMMVRKAGAPDLNDWKSIRATLRNM